MSPPSTDSEFDSIFDIISNLDLNSDINTPPLETHDQHQLDPLGDISNIHSTHPFLGGALTFLKYILTSVGIFFILLFSTNYSAYSNIAKSYLFESSNQSQENLLLASIDNSDIQKASAKEQLVKKENKNTLQNKELLSVAPKIEKQLSRSEIITKNTKQAYSSNSNFSISSLLYQLNTEDIDLGVNIVPYGNRIVIPKIGKNIPLIDTPTITTTKASELNDIFMKELEDGVVRYPGSAKPGEIGNSFIFGHSSNFPWIAGNYNDVFSRLGQLQVGDVIFSYYGQKKYKYIIKEKKVIRPSNTDILDRGESKSELTLMTCWPVGTTLNRLILVGELVEESNT